MARHYADQSYTARLTSIRRIRNTLFGCPRFVVGTSPSFGHGSVFSQTMPDTQLGHMIAGWDREEWIDQAVTVTVRWHKGDYRIIKIERIFKA